MFKLNKIVDLRLLLIVLALISIGFLAIASATGLEAFGQVNRKLITQMASFGIGFIMMAVLIIIDYHIWGKIWWLIYILSIAALLLVYVPGLGVTHYNARSWINLGFMDFQTSEIAKIGFILAFAKLLALRKGKLNNPLELISPVIMIAPIIFLLKEQPDLGTMLVFVFVFLGMIFVAGINIKIVLLSLISAVVAAPFVYNSLEPYQRKRITSFLYPNDPTQDSYWQLLMSRLTIGSGGFKGQGLFKGSFSANNFLPVQESDFIFAVLVEEMGFIGGATVIVLFLLLFTRLIHIAFIADDDFGTNIVIGVLFMQGFHVFQNIGMTMGLMPVTGVPLPFISYGGSSLLINMISIGLVMSVYLHREVIDENIVNI